MPGYGFWQLRSVVLAVAGTALCCNPAFAQSLEAALAYAYANNPQLNAQRAQVRATDENVPTALAGYRPRASITANAGSQSLSTTTREIGSTTPLGAPATYFTQSGVNAPRGVGATVTQNVLNGFQTANRTRQAEAQVFAARETLRNIEQTVLLSAATAYMNLLRDSGILELQRSNVEVLRRAVAPGQAAARAGQRHADRRLAIGGAARGRAHAIVRGRGRLRDLQGDVPPGHRPRAGAAAAGLAGRPLLAEHTCGRDRDRNRVSSHRHDGAVQRRCRLMAGEGRRRRALSDRRRCRQRAEELRDHRCNRCRSFSGSRRRPVLDADLSGRRRIRRDPASQRDARPASARSQRRPRPGARNCGSGLGAARRRQKQHRVRHAVR